MEIKELTIEEKIGQMIMIGMDTNYITDRIRNMITKYKIGGVILYRKNFSTYDEMIKLIKELKQLNSKNKIPLFISVDQEGGRVNRMPKEIKNLPSARKIAEQGEVTVKKAAQITGKILRKSGYNLNFSPVLDIEIESDRKAIGDRSFGEDKDIVSKCGITTMRALQEEHIISVIKHFPGHGATNQDSHHFLPIITKRIKELENIDMYPFKEAIENGADAILVGHLLIPSITGIYPASLSRRFIVKYLRQKNRYKGLVITDDLKMKAIRFIYGPDLAIKKAFEAGNDIILFRFNEKEEKRVINQIVKATKNGKIKEARIDRSVRRVVKMKEKYEVSDDEEIEKIDIDEINKEIEKIRNKCNI